MKLQFASLLKKIWNASKELSIKGNTLKRKAEDQEICVGQLKGKKKIKGRDEMKDREARVKILDQIATIEDEYCKICTDPSKNNNKYCTTNCEVGKQIKSLGDVLQGVKPEVEIRKVEKKMEKEVATTPKTETPSKERYLEYKDKGWTDHRIKELWGIHTNKFTAMKKQWGLIGVFGPKAKKKEEAKPVGIKLDEKAPEVIKESKLTASKISQSEVEDLQLDLKEVKAVLKETKEERDRLKVQHEELLMKLALFQDERNQAIHERNEVQHEKEQLQRFLEDVQKKYDATLDFAKAHFLS